MAAMLKLCQRNVDIDDDFYALGRQAEDNRYADYYAATKIQAWIRGCKVRIYIKHLHKAAEVIQQRWRGFLGRQAYGNFVLDLAYMARTAYYNRMAEKIQCLWKAYFTRKYIFNFYTRKNYLKSLVVKNEIIRSELQNYANQQILLDKIRDEDDCKRRLIAYASDHHHLISTLVQPGVYNSPYKSCPDEIEFHLRNMQAPKIPGEKSSLLRYDPSCKSYNAAMLTSLPALASRPQGPFKTPAEVQLQRYRPFLPSLRVETDFFSLERAQHSLRDVEWTQRLHDDVMHPYNLTKEKPYERLLSSTAIFGRLPYGSKHFRELNRRNFVSPNDFKMVVPPIPVFDKFTGTYSRGEV